MVRTLLVIMFSLITSYLEMGCDEALPTMEPKEETLPSSNKTAVLIIEAPQVQIGDAKYFRRWSELPKTKGQVHLFGDPANESILDKWAGTKHVVTIDRLSDEITTTLASLRADRLLIFIATHGASSGNWCYQDRNTCSLSEQVLIDALQTQAKIISQQLRHVLIVPLSCFNKLIMDRFAQKSAALQWPFDLSFVAQKSVASCNSQSPAHSLAKNLLFSYHPVEDAQLNEFLSIADLDRFIEFNNSLIRIEWSESSYEVRHIKAPATPITLADFGFDILIQTAIDSRSRTTVFPFNKTVKDVVSGFVSSSLYKNIEELVFQEPNAPPVKTDVKGDVFKVITEPVFQGKGYHLSWVIFRRR